jgi:hypothetical protein
MESSTDVRVSSDTKNRVKYCSCEHIEDVHRISVTGAVEAPSYDFGCNECACPCFKIDEEVTTLKEAMDIDLSKSRVKPYDHQVIGVHWLTKDIDEAAGRIHPNCFFLADDMRLGKTKQVIDAAQVLFWQNKINRVIVAAPAPVRTVWYDRELGELAKHLWMDTPAQVTEYHGKGRSWKWGKWGEDDRRLEWFITNYEYIGVDMQKTDMPGEWSGWNVDPLIEFFCTPQTMLVLDESAWVKSFKANRTRACMMLRQHVGRIVLLNGTPIAHSPGDLFSQSYLLHPDILGCHTSTEFKRMYATTKQQSFRGRRPFLKVMGWKNQTLLQKRLAPYVLRRMREDCLDLPPKLPPVVMSATLTQKTWDMYKELRDEFILWLNDNTSASAAQAGVRAMRLAQLTSGFLGGLSVESECPCEGEDAECEACTGSGIITQGQPPAPVGDEKLKVLTSWIEQRLDEDENLRMLIWCRFRPELFRIHETILEKFPQVRPGKIHGGQKKVEREDAMRIVHPEVKYNGPGILVGTVGTGSVGLNMAGAHEVVYASNDYSLFKRKQSEDRPHGPGQTTAVSYHDIIAEGPKGQETIDHVILVALKNRDEVASWTCSAWIKALRKAAENE